MAPGKQHRTLLGPGLWAVSRLSIDRMPPGPGLGFCSCCVEVNSSSCQSRTVWVSVTNIYSTLDVRPHLKNQVFLTLSTVLHLSCTKEKPIIIACLNLHNVYLETSSHPFKMTSTAFLSGLKTLNRITDWIFRNDYGRALWQMFTVTGMQLLWPDHFTVCKFREMSYCASWNLQLCTFRGFYKT